MLAGVLLQSYAVPLPSAAAVSIMRFGNTGPWSLLGKMKMKWDSGSFSIGLLAVLLTITTLSLQFTSTALLSQVGLAALPIQVTVPQTFYSTDPDGATLKSYLGEGAPFIQTTPKGYPTFAEWVSKSTSSEKEFAPSSSPGMVDTGTVMRAFLPINDTNERSRLTDYQGYATVVDMRVVCMRPKLTNVVFSSRSGTRLTGVINNEQKPLGLAQSIYYKESSDFAWDFECGFGAAGQTDYIERYGWPLTLCETSPRHSTEGMRWLKNIAFKLRRCLSFLIPLLHAYLFAGIASVMQPKGGKNPGSSYLLINATVPDYVTNMDGSDVWESLTLKANDTDTDYRSLQMTLCMTAFEAQEMMVHATRPTAPPEPVLSWNSATAIYDTAAVLRQLGAGKSTVSVTERGLFDLAPRSWEWPTPPQSYGLTSGYFSTTEATKSLGLGDIYLNQINKAQYSVLGRMATATADPALTLQAFFSTLMAMNYYDKIALFDTSAPSTQTSLEQVAQPLGWTAYIIVLSMVAFHLLLVLLTTFIFYRAGTFSRIGNAWAVISQTIGPVTENWIMDTDMVDDKAVERWLKEGGLQDELVGVEDVLGRVKLVRKEKLS